MSSMQRWSSMSGGWTQSMYRSTPAKEKHRCRSFYWHWTVINRDLSLTQKRLQMPKWFARHRVHRCICRQHMKYPTCILLQGYYSLLYYSSISPEGSQSFLWKWNVLKSSYSALHPILLVGIAEAIDELLWNDWDRTIHREANGSRDTWSSKKIRTMHKKIHRWHLSPPMCYPLQPSLYILHSQYIDNGVCLNFRVNNADTKGGP